MTGLAAPAGAVQPPTLTPAVQFVGHAARICLNTKADPAAVRRLAAAEKWTAIDPGALPDHPPQYIVDGKIYTRAHAWTLQWRGTTYWVGLFDVPGRPGIRDCSFMAHDLDFEAVNAVFTGNKPPPEGAQRELPVRKYRLGDATLTYGWSSAGEKRLHVVSVTPVP